MKKLRSRGVYGGPVVKTSPSNAGGVRLIAGQEAKVPTCFEAKRPNKKKEAIITNYIQTIITNSIKTSKNDLHQKKKR